MERPDGPVDLEDIIIPMMNNNSLSRSVELLLQIIADLMYVPNSDGRKGGVEYTRVLTDLMNFTDVLTFILAVHSLKAVLIINHSELIIAGKNYYSGELRVGNKQSC